MGDAAIEASGVCRRYGRRWALVDVGFSVPRGAIAMLSGRNGSGKSTLLRVLATAIRADRGTAAILGHDVRHAPREVRSVSALLGHASFLYESLTALENMEVVARLRGLPSRREDILPLLDRVGLADRATDAPSAFSAGMRKRLSLARLMLQSPSVAFLDEPYAQLDMGGFRLVDELIESFRRRAVTVLMATHQVERGVERCDLAVVLEAGRVEWVGPPRDASARAVPRSSVGDAP